MLEPDSTRKYYEMNAATYSHRTRCRVERDLLEAFARYLSFESRLVDLGPGSGKDLSWFQNHPLKITPVGIEYSSALAREARAFSKCEVIEADLKLYAFPKDYYSAAWANRIFSHFNPVLCQRVLGGLFATLKRKSPLMLNFISGAHGSSFEDRYDNSSGPARIFYRFSEPEFSSLLLQSGFTLLSKASLKERDETWVTLLARRI